MKKFLAIAMIAATLTSCGGGNSEDASKEGAMSHEDSVAKGLITETPVAMSHEDSVAKGLITETPVTMSHEDSVAKGLITEEKKEEKKEAKKEGK